jgi:NADPH2:quinone reductase
VPGVEAAGEVLAVGPEVRDWAVGDRVAFAGEMSCVYAEASVVGEHRLVAVPAGLPLDVAAAITIQGLTAHMLATAVHPVAAGETVLVHAAASGVGHLLGRLARLRGATVIGTTSSPAKAAQVEADHVVVTSDPGWEERVRALTGGNGVHAVFDGIGAATFDQGCGCCAPAGRWRSTGWRAGPSRRSTSTGSPGSPARPSAARCGSAGRR